MAEAASLSTYIVRIHKRGDRKKRAIKFGEVTCNGSTANEKFKEILESLNTSPFKYLGKAISTFNPKSLGGRDETRLYVEGDRVYGQLDYGSSGYVSIIKDMETNETKYKRRRQDAEVIPIYFMMSVPSDSYRGLLFTQNIGHKGMKTIFDEYVKKKFRTACPGYTLRIEPYLDENLKRFLIENGKLVSAKMISSSLSSDAASNALNPENEHDVVFETIVKPRGRGGQLAGLQKRISSLFSGGRTPSKSDFDEEFLEDYKLDIKYKGGTRTVQLFGFQGHAARFPLNNEISIDAFGFPNFREVHDETVNLEADMRAQSL